MKKMDLQFRMEERIEDKHHTMWFEKIALKLEIEKLDEKERLILYMRYQLDFNKKKWRKD